MPLSTDRASAQDFAPLPRTFGLILAGGLGRRMGGVDKALVPLAGRPLLAHVQARLAPQVERLLLSANGDPARFAAFGLTVLPDTLPDYPGPLAGVLAGMEAVARLAPEVEWLVSTPADSPLIPLDLVAQLHRERAITGAPMAHAASGDRTHPVVALWPIKLRHALNAYLAAGERRVGRFTEEQGATQVAWNATVFDPFANVNTPDDLVATAHEIGKSF
ncbi:molybdenum cofactor guanylyltransferase [Azorhizobium oxalatiphilum]|uniref:Molybdenum cofactor guanylyltransferase n=1 Tax=Azorhizobium oxalatiphilum TaxID=980631 RepID=A0A917CDL4_9HYPH|nr:molybdenum cofactor guanylyltransferase MobA [Azorhizobium oxalatiphilum]GGF84023.1 molybdenum cofactor guanylyltransferase [Azorhizobium oxalatiphilum]